MDTQHTASTQTPWAPELTQLPLEWLELYDTLSQSMKGSPQATRIYILNVRYNARRVAEQARHWGLSWQVVMAAYLWEYDEEQIRAANLIGTDEVLCHIGAARLYAHYIEEENLPPLFTPPYRNLGALLLATAVYIQTLQLLQEQSQGQPYVGKMYSSIEGICSILRNIYKVLGMWRQKRIVEDLTEQLLNPSRYKDNEQELRSILERDNKNVEAVCQLLRDTYQEASGRPFIVLPIACGVAGMRRRLQSVGGTVQKPQLTAFDLVTFQIIVPTVSECYTAFGILSLLGHSQDRVVIEQIINPKSNGSSSIILKILLKMASPDTKDLGSSEAHPYLCLLQITTHFMHAVTWYGCLYPDCYALYSTVENSYPGRKGLPSVTELWHSEEGKVLSAIIENFSNRQVLPSENAPIIVYDKDRKPISLPKGSTVLDFAYTVDSTVGEHAVDAMVNYRKSPLSRILDAGDIVEVRTASEIQAQEYWLSQGFSRTVGARRKIKDSLRRRLYDRGGYNRLSELLERYHYRVNPDILDEELRRLVKEHHLGTPLEYLERLNKGSKQPYTAEWAAQQIIEQISERNEASLTGTAKSGWVPRVNRKIIMQQRTVQRWRLCGFCRPTYPQDANILGRLRKHGGELVVHAEDCPHLLDTNSVLVPMSWQPLPPAFPVSFFMTGQDRKGLIFDLTRLLGSYQCILTSIQAETLKFSDAQIRFTINVHTDKEALAIWRATEKIHSVAKVEVDAVATAPSIHHRLERQRKQSIGTLYTSALEPDWTESMELHPPRSSNLTNPFDISRPAAGKMFFGRSEEMTQLRDILCGGPQGKALLLHGPLRSGKSSICTNFIDNHLFFPAWGVLCSLQNVPWQDEEGVLKHISDKITSKLGEQFNCFIPNWHDYSNGDPQTRFLQIMRQCMAQVPETRFVLVLDEFGGAIESHQKGILAFRFFTFWRELMNEIPQMSLLLAMPTSAHALLTTTKFANVFSFTEPLEVSFLDTDSAQRLLTDPLREQYIEVHPITVAQAVKQTGGSPYYMTMLGQRLIEYLNQETYIQLVTDTELRTVLEQIIGEGAPYNFNFLRKEIQSKEEFRVLEGCVELMSKIKQSKVQSKRIADWLGMPVLRVKKHLQRLRVGLILDEIGPPSNPYYSFKIDLVRRWLMRNSWFFTSYEQEIA